MTYGDTLQNYGINTLWHFTDRSNLDSIEKNGLLSLHNIISYGIKVSRFGADELSHSLDLKYGLDKFIHLAFIKDHPMYHVAKQRKSIVDPIWLEIDISVLDNEKVFLCNKVANASNSKLFDMHRVDISSIINFNDLCNSRDFQTKKEARKAEILVPSIIYKEQIIGVYNGN